MTVVGVQVVVVVVVVVVVSMGGYDLPAHSLLGAAATRDSATTNLSVLIEQTIGNPTHLTSPSVVWN